MNAVSISRFGVCAMVSVFLVVSASGQGLIAVNNINGRGTHTSTNFGLFFDVNGGLSLAPINVTILGGPDASSLTPLVTLAGPNALVTDFPGGRYRDPSSGVYSIPGIASGQPAVLQVLAWHGSAVSFYAADPRQDWFWPFGGDHFVDPRLFTFTNPTGGTVPPSLDGMPAMVRLLDAPEPESAWLLLLGLPWLFFRRSRNK